METALLSILSSHVLLAACVSEGQGVETGRAPVGDLGAVRDRVLCREVFTGNRKMTKKYDANAWGNLLARIECELAHAPRLVRARPLH